MIGYKLFFWQVCHYSEAMSILLQETLCTHICPDVFFVGQFCDNVCFSESFCQQV